MIINFISKVLGLHDKEQKARTQMVSDYSKTKRAEFSSEMDKVKTQAKKIQQKQLHLHSETDKLVTMVEDMTQRILIATGGANRG